MSVDIQSKEGQQIIQDLARKCDVVVENFLPGTLEKYSLGWDNLSAINPSLIHCSITGYGHEGLYSSRPGYDVMAQAMGGMMHITGPAGPDGEPCKLGVALIDIITGLHAHGAILAALRQRDADPERKV